MVEKQHFTDIPPDKLQAFRAAEQLLLDDGFKIVSFDIQRPWGAFLVVDNSQAKQFIDRFFNGVDLGEINASMPLQPKILIFEPEKRLSLQLHHRRREIWRGLAGEFQALTGPDEDHLSSRVMRQGDVLFIEKEEMHRAVGGMGYSSAAEIWQHTDKQHLSDEDDIDRIQDDWGR